MTVGCDRLDAYQDVQSHAVGIIDAKIHIKSIISDAHYGASYCTADIKVFFSPPCKCTNTCVSIIGTS